MEPEIIINIVLILLVAWLFGDLFRRLGMPRLLGELLAGLILGPPLLGWIQSREGMTILADLGVFFLMFYSGMEMDPHKLLEHFWLALAAAVAGFIFPFAAGYGVARLFGATVFQSLFIATGLSVTSLAVGARVLQDMEIHRSKVGHIIIGAAIIDDVLALVAFSMLTGLAKTGQIDPAGIVLLFLKVIAFIGGGILVGLFLMPRLTRRLKDEEAKGYTFALIVALIMGFLAEKAGLHIIVGAFLAGQFVREGVVEPALHQKLRNQFYNAIHGFLGPIFFASLSFHISLNLTAKDWEFLGAIVLVAMLGKVAGCGLPLLILRNWRESLVIGVGMNGRGEVLLVVANAVLSLSFIMSQAGVIQAPLLTQSQFTILILLAFITTLMTPILLRLIMPPLCAHYEKDFCKIWRHSDE
ncbi:MAG: cation:proton antiporter [Deltaproteobacteria bacterium]|nr:cation:proton antiporter [Deltaproteobacteria bacterium]